MTAILYWTTRGLLVAAWLWAAVVLVRRSRLESNCRIAKVAAAVAVAFASMRAWPWNYGLLVAARQGLSAAGIYEQRLAAKVVVAVLLGALAAAAGRWWWHRAGARIGRGTGLGLLLQGMLIAMETLSLDDLLPDLVRRQPGRHLAEGGNVALVLWSLHGPSPAQGSAADRGAAP